MKIALNILLSLAALGLVYLLIESIRKPITFKETGEIREEQVRERLTQAAELQKIYKALHGKYADNYDSLKYVLTHDTFLVEQVIGDKYDTNQVVSTVEVKIPAKDSLKGFIKKSLMKVKKPMMSIDEYFDYVTTVPFSDGQKFYIKTGEAIVEGTDSMMTSTFEVGTTIGTYMAEFDSAGHVIYDPEYNPNKLRKVGDLYKPSTNGNW
ncbi:hypothetical protein [Aureispira anguillae]|uniref:Uncharacterized protein n=1 Tax=Aureispira anguillae TaxID=2864201 RepID=A0A916DTH6_9BACT|nr:hypothetical protein [Aureispira anguillae]BDS11860.1 hypothetical protein AsAng_0025740 [Aureispira anguillae]